MDPSDYKTAAMLLPRAFGVTYFFVFSAFIFQMTGLFGKEGILPITTYLGYFKQRFGKTAYQYIPTIYWFKSSDEFLVSSVILGTFLALLLAFGIAPPLMLLLLYVLHLSALNAGQDFLSFGWEIFLLEITINTFFLSLTTIPNVFIWMSLNLLLFRFYFQGGVSKTLSCDVNWRNCTGTSFHYETQPIPNMFAWFVHKLPLWFRKFSTVAMLFIEIAVPFGIFATQEIRLATFILFTILQWSIWITGNFSYLNHMSVAFSIILVSDAYLGSIFFVPETFQTSLYLEIVISIIGVALLGWQIVSLYHYFFPHRIFAKILGWGRTFCIGNRYGIFAVMTTHRYEVVVEGSEDGMEWKEYAFYFKPSELTYRPRRISPFQPRLDWQIWFLPFTNYESENWFQQFLYRLLVGSPEVLKLLRVNPFQEKPPKYIRALLYEYHFSSFKSLKTSGRWWERELIEEYSPVLSLRSHEKSEFF